MVVDGITACGRWFDCITMVAEEYYIVHIPLFVLSKYQPLFVLSEVGWLVRQEATSPPIHEPLAEHLAVQCCNALPRTALMLWWGRA